MHQNKNKLELVPPNDHRTNPAKKCIDTFKCHLISGLSAMDPNFPLHLWCRILPQCQDTLNMLFTSRRHPHMSSFTHMNGPFDYNATPIVPPGIKTLTQDLPVSRTKTIHITVVEPSDLLATDLTGRFPTISIRGYNYIIVCYIYDTNGIIVRPMKNRSVAEHTRVHNEIFWLLGKTGTLPSRPQDRQ